LAIKKEYKVAIVSAVAGVIATGIYDFIKEKPILSTLWSGLKWIWNTIFEAQFTVWQFLLFIIILLALLLFILWLTTKGVNSSSNAGTANWLAYEEDTIDGTTWKWNWEKGLSGKYEAKHLRPLCHNCGTSMQFYEGSWDTYYECPRCDERLKRVKSKYKVESIILDNVHRGKLPPNHG